MTYGDRFCKVELSRPVAGTDVDIECSNTHHSEVVAAVARVAQQAQSSSVVSISPPASGQPPAPAPAKADVRPGTHQVEYTIDGTARAAGLTYRNAGGGTEQNDVALPATLSFRTVAGAFVYISAQKKGEEGTVHVAIRVDGILMRQSISSSPYGIASASGRVVDRKIVY